MRILLICLGILISIWCIQTSRISEERIYKSRDLFDWLFEEEFRRPSSHFGRRRYWSREDGRDRYRGGYRRRNRRTNKKYTKLILNRKMFYYWDKNYEKWSNWSECQPMNCVKTRYRRCRDDSWQEYVTDFKVEQKCPVKFIYERMNCNESTECGPTKKNITKIGNLTTTTLPKNCGVRPDQIENKILGGNSAKTNAWPWHVALYVTSSTKSFYICGGTLINSGWVVTAAHCLTSINSLVRLPLGTLLSTKKYGFHNTFKVVMGVTNRKLEKKAIISRLSHVILHPEFIADYSTNLYDVALLKLQTPVDSVLSNIDFACVPQSINYTLPTGTKCYAVGWGNTRTVKPFDFWSYEFSWIFDKSRGRGRGRRPRKERKRERERNLGPNQIPTVLQQAEIPLVDFNKCFKQYILFNLKPTYHICAGTHEKDTCRGDSGGGLFCMDPKTKNWQLYGITNFGSARGCGKSYGVYGKMSAVVEWLKRIIQMTPN